MIPTENLTITIPISRSARQTAMQFAQEQPTSEKATQVYLNTLAVLVVYDYLQMLEIPTELAASQSWNRIGRIFANLADLKVTGVGHLECRPVKVNERTCYIPSEVWQDRIGCVVVQLNEADREGILLGFIPPGVQQLSIDRLQPLEALLVRLHQPALTLVQLSQWFDNVFATGWREIEELLNSRQALAFRQRKDPVTDRGREKKTGSNRVTRAKKIDLGMQLTNRAVALLIELEPKAEKTNIFLQVHPTDSLILPFGLQLGVLDESGEILAQVSARSADNYIQLQFAAQVGEQFSVRVTLERASITEHFRV